MSLALGGGSVISPRVHERYVFPAFALAAPLAIVGAFRVPRPGRLRAVARAVIPGVIVATAALLFAGYALVPAAQLRCP